MVSNMRYPAEDMTPSTSHLRMHFHFRLSIHQLQIWERKLHRPENLINLAEDKETVHGIGAVEKL